MIEDGVTAGILGSAITPTSVAPGGARKTAAMGDITQPHGYWAKCALDRLTVQTGNAADTDRETRSPAFGRRLATDARPATMELRSTIEGLRLWMTKLVSQSVARSRRSVSSWKTSTLSFSRRILTPSWLPSERGLRCSVSSRTFHRRMIPPRRNPQSMKDTPLFSMGFIISSGFGSASRGVWKDRVEANGFGTVLAYDAFGRGHAIPGWFRKSAALRRQDAIIPARCAGSRAIVAQAAARSVACSAGRLPEYPAMNARIDLSVSGQSRRGVARFTPRSPLINFQSLTARTPNWAGLKAWASQNDLISARRCSCLAIRTL